MACNENLSWYDSPTHLSVSVEGVMVCVYFFFNWTIIFCVLLRQNTWQEVLEVELERRSSDRSLFDEGKRYVDLKPEDRVSKISLWVVFQFLYHLTYVFVGVLFIVPRTFKVDRLNTVNRCKLIIFANCTRTSRMSLLNKLAKRDLLPKWFRCKMAGA